MQMLMNPPFMLVKPSNYVVVSNNGKTERVVFGANLPLTKRAANSFAKTHVKGEFRVIMRKTAQRAGLI